MEYTGQTEGWDDVRLVYDGVAVIEERDLENSGSLLCRYYYEDGINKPALIETGAGTCIPLTDDRGSVMGVTDTSGTLLEKLYYNTSGLCRSYDATVTPNLPNLRYGTSYNIGRSLRQPFGYWFLFCFAYDAFRGTSVTV